MSIFKVGDKITEISMSYCINCAFMGINRHTTIYTVIKILESSLNLDVILAMIQCDTCRYIYPRVWLYHNETFRYKKLITIEL
jgi:hypothetical protein